MPTTTREFRKVGPWCAVTAPIEIAESLTKKYKIPVTVATIAQVDAFRALGMKKLVLNIEIMEDYVTSSLSETTGCFLMAGVYPVAARLVAPQERTFQCRSPLKCQGSLSLHQKNTFHPWALVTMQ